MKEKTVHTKNIEKKVNAIFYQREVQNESYGCSKRVPKRSHYAAGVKKGSNRR